LRDEISKEELERRRVEIEEDRKSFREMGGK